MIKAQRNDIVGITFSMIFFQLMNDKSLRPNQNHAIKAAGEHAYNKQTILSAVVDANIVILIVIVLGVNRSLFSKESIQLLEFFFPVRKFQHALLFSMFIFIWSSKLSDESGFFHTMR